MNSNIITIPPRKNSVAVRPRVPAPPVPVTVEPNDDDLRRLALEIVQHDPVLAHLLSRAGQRNQAGGRLA